MHPYIPNIAAFVFSCSRIESRARGLYRGLFEAYGCMKSWVELDSQQSCFFLLPLFIFAERRQGDYQEGCAHEPGAHTQEERLAQP